MNDRLTLGAAYLEKQGAFRALGAYMLSPETDKLPSTHLSAGVQGIGTGNPGYSLTAEKNWNLGGASGLNVFLGVGYRTNRKIARMVGGFKYSPDGHWNIGLQNDGLVNDPFVTYSADRWTAGMYLIDMEHAAYMIGVRF